MILITGLTLILSTLPKETQLTALDANQEKIDFMVC